MIAKSVYSLLGCAQANLSTASSKSTLIFRCICRRASPFNLFSSIKDCKYVFNLHNAEKLLLALHDVTGKVRNISGLEQATSTASNINSKQHQQQATSTAEEHQQQATLTASNINSKQHQQQATSTADNCRLGSLADEI